MFINTPQYRGIIIKMMPYETEAKTVFLYLKSKIKFVKFSKR